MAILFVSGINDLSTVGVTADDAGNMVHLLDGNCSIHQRVPLRSGLDAYAILFGKGVKQRQFEFIATPSQIVVWPFSSAGRMQQKNRVRGRGWV